MFQGKLLISSLYKFNIDNNGLPEINMPQKT